MAKKPTKRARAQAERAAKVKAVQATGYTKRAASKFVESLKEKERTTGKPMTAKDLATEAANRREGAIAQSRSMKTARGAAYVAQMDERQRIANNLRSRGILAAQFEDLAAAAVEGRYKEALAFNRKVYDEYISKVNDLIDDNKQHLIKATGDERREILDEINFLTHERESLIEQSARYGIGKALNIKNTAAVKILAKLL